jgi:dolichol-phosphate mannosyltransferase
MSAMKTSILIPVYNEAKNIERLIMKINDINKNFSIVIIDDDSQDGTHKILENFKDKFNVHSYVRKNKRGYGSALIYGFNQVKDSDIVVTMDADLSHDPSVIPSLINEINNGYEVVIGSRYIEGGEIHAWPLFRRITSKLVNLFVAICLQTSIKDNTSGYRAYSKTAINKLLRKINSKGYSVLEEILYWVKQQNLTCKEIPIVFIGRKEGVSKAKMIKEFARLLSLVSTLRKRSKYHE